MKLPNDHRDTLYSQREPGFNQIPIRLDDITSLKDFHTTYKILFVAVQNTNFGPSADAGNTKGGSITVPLTSCLTGLESAV